MDFSKGFYPAKRNSGFRMDGYFVWCGSCIKGENGRYYLFASRWKEELGFPEGYMVGSEIVLASADAPDAPFRFEKVIFSKRDTHYWDGMMTHNPFIMRWQDEYLLFYIGCSDGTWETRKIGIARSKSLTEGWQRPNFTIELPQNANNPSAILGDDGKIYLVFRDGQLRVSVAMADSVDGRFRVVAENIFPLSPIEDMYLFKNNGRYEIIAEDNQGGYTGTVGGGAHFFSYDMIHWTPCDPIQVYGREISYEGGETITLQRRERPFLFEDEGRIFLFTTAKINGKTRESGGITWNMVQEFKK